MENNKTEFDWEWHWAKKVAMDRIYAEKNNTSVTTRDQEKGQATGNMDKNGRQGCGEKWEIVE